MTGGRRRTGTPRPICGTRKRGGLQWPDSRSAALPHAACISVLRLANAKSASPQLGDHRGCRDRRTTTQASWRPPVRWIVTSRSGKRSIGAMRSMPFIMRAATEASRSSAWLKASARPAGLVSVSRADVHDLRRDRRRRACCAASRAPAGRAPDHLCAPHRHRPAPRGLSGATSVYTASPGFNADPGSRDRAITTPPS